MVFFCLRLPQPDGSIRRQECADVPVELRTGFSDSLTFSLKDDGATAGDAVAHDGIWSLQVEVPFPEGFNPEGSR